jgi:hypothetical protein
MTYNVEALATWRHSCSVRLMPLVFVRVAYNDHRLLPAVELKDFSRQAAPLFIFIYRRGLRSAGW